MLLTLLEVGTVAVSAGLTVAVMAGLTVAVSAGLRVTGMIAFTGCIPVLAGGRLAMILAVLGVTS